MKTLLNLSVVSVLKGPICPTSVRPTENATCGRSVVDAHEENIYIMFALLTYWTFETTEQATMHWQTLHTANMMWHFDFIVMVYAQVPYLHSL